MKAKPNLPWQAALDLVIDRQISWLGNHPWMGTKPRPPKYRIRGIELEEGWRYWIDLSPCPACNPPNGEQHIGQFFREVFGTIEWCKKHQAFWDRFHRETGGMIQARPLGGPSPTFRDLGRHG